MKPLIRVLGLGAALLLVVGAGVFGGNRKAIQQARARAEALEVQRDSLVGVVARREAEQSRLAARVDTLETQAGGLRDSVNLLERHRAQAQLDVRTIRTVGALQTRLRRAFPELGKSGWGLTSLPAWPGDTLGIDYLLVPAWFAETFVIDRANARSWRAQRNALLAVDSLRLRITVLQDSIVTLETASRQAYEAGYRAAWAGYQDLSKRYVAELSRPRVTLGSTVGLIVTAGACAVAAGAAHD